MQYKKLLLLCGMLGPVAASAQTGVGIGTAKPAASAALDVTSTTQGLLPPRMNQAQRNAIANPAAGLVVYQTDNSPGLYGYSGTAWQLLAADNLGSHTASQNLLLADNDLLLRPASSATSSGLGWYGPSGGSKSWMGYDIDGPVLYGKSGGVLGTNSGTQRTSALYWNAAGRVGIGTTAPDASAALDVTSTIGGLLLPRLTAAQRLAMGSPATALLVFQTDAPTAGAGASSAAGFWYNAGTPAIPNWLRITDAMSYSAAGLQIGSPGSAALPLSPRYYLSDLSPFAGSQASYRLAYYIPASLLQATGINPDQPLTSLALNVYIKNSTGPFTDFTIQLGNAATNPSASSANPSEPLTTVYSQNVTTVTGLNTFSFNTPFKWDGVSGLYVQFCYANTAAVGDDYILGDDASTPTVHYVSGSGACGLAYNYYSHYLPTMTFAQGAAYTLPAAAGTPGQVLTQQASGNVAFQTPQWSQSGLNLYASVPDSRLGLGVSSPDTAYKAHVRTARASANALLVQLSGKSVAQSLRLDHNGSNFIVRPLAAGGNSTIIENTGGGALIINPTGGGVGIGTTPNATYLLDVNGAVRGTASYTTSDQRLKQQVRPLTGALAAVQALRGVRYRWNALGVKRGGKADAEQVGFLAQEIERLYPELVSTDAEGYKAVNYAQLTPVLLEALKELAARHEALQAQVQADHADLQTLHLQLARLQAAAAPAADQARR